MKTKILVALKGTEGFVSGQQLCEQFGVSRTAVWKVIAQLKEEGYEIESVRNKGYRLVLAPDVFSGSEICSRMHTHNMAQKVLFYDEIDSTNQFLKQHGEEYPDGTLVVANIQTAGKGSRGRSWSSPKDVAIAMSLLLKPSMTPQQAPKLTLVMAVSIARALEKMGVHVQIKWPNDIVLNGRKLVGILTEMHGEVDYIHYVIIGIGINVLTESFPEEIRERATSLLIETGRRFNRSELVARIMECFEEDYEAFLKAENLAPLLDTYRKYSVTIGSQVRVLACGEEYCGTAVDVDEQGYLYVKKEDQTVEKVFADEVSVRGIYGYV